MFSPYLNRFIQPDTIVPDPSNPQAFNRYSYVYGNPLRYIDPSGHDPHCGPDGIHCGVDPTQATTGWLLGPQWNNNSGSASSGGGGNTEVDIPQCGYHHCGETFDIVEAYELGWQNFGQAWNIYWNPNATYGQRWLAGAYMGYWGGAHLCLVICTAVAAIEYLIPGAISCAVMLHCAGAVFYSGGKVAYQEATKYANSTGRYTINMTVPGRILDSLDKFKLFSSNTMDSLWEFASRRFANGASGVVNSFLNATTYNPLRTYGRVELPILKSNPNVLQIIHNVIIP